MTELDMLRKEILAADELMELSPSQKRVTASTRLPWIVFLRTCAQTEPDAKRILAFRSERVTQYSAHRRHVCRKAIHDKAHLLVSMEAYRERWMSDRGPAIHTVHESQDWVELAEGCYQRRRHL